AVARRDVAADFAFARPDGHDVGVRWSDRHGADRGARDLSIGHRPPRRTPIARLPQSPARGAEVILERPSDAAGHGNRSSSAVRTDVAPPKRAKRSGRIGYARAGTSATLGDDGRVDRESEEDASPDTQPYRTRTC